MRSTRSGRHFFVWPALVFALTFFLAYSVSAQALLQTGSQAPSFSLQDLEGGTVSLSDHAQKKAVVILFWSTWSANSGKALKRFEDFHRKYRDKGIQILGINTDNQTLSPEDVVQIKAVVRGLGITFPSLLDRGLATFRAYGTIALPSTVVITGGRISYELPGLPLVATEDMFDYLSVLAGDPPRKKMEKMYEPVHAAIADTNLARGFVRKKMSVMAYPLFRKAIEKDPKYILPYVELAKLLEAEGNAQEAVETLNKALSVSPDSVVVMSELGYLLVKTGKLKEAVDILGKAAAKNSYTPSHYYYAYALGKDGNMKEALPSFEAALSLNPFEPSIFLLRAELYENGAMLKEASADYKKALALMLNVKE